MKKRFRWPHLSLLAKFSLVSLALVTALGVLLAWGIQRQLEQNALSQEAESAVDRAVSVIEPNITSADLDGSISPERYAQIDTLIRQSLLSKHLVRVKIWDPTGLILYSEDKALVGRQFPPEDDLEEAMSGHIVMGVSSLDADENVEERGDFSELLEVYMPLRTSDSGDIQAVLEVYHDMVSLQARINEMRLFVWTSLGLGFIVLYGMLFTLVRRASRDLTHRNAENARLYQEATAQLAERVRAEESLGRQVARLASLRAIDTAIIMGKDLHSMLVEILEHVTEQLKVDAADVLVLNPATEMLVYSVGRGFRTNAVVNSTVRLGEWYAGRAVRERSTIKLPDLGQAREMLRGHSLAAEDFKAYYAVPLMAKGRVKGVLEIFHRSTLDPNREWHTFLEALAGQVAIAVDNATLFEALQRSNMELSLAYDTTLEGWSHALDLRDKETEGHTQRVTEMTLRLARALGLPEEQMVHMRRGALLHDIGKMGIPDAILLKPGPLTEAEWEIMRLHPVYAYELLSPIPFLRPALDIPYCHHEKWDGTGYPRGLKGGQIPVAARIFAIVDVWDALRSDRPYRAAWPEQQVIVHLRSLAKSHFDPAIVEAFLRLKPWALEPQPRPGYTLSGTTGKLELVGS
jgi:HD-GYP domain-containing protein (c-di-GMP phosphodiesterase class II)